MQSTQRPTLEMVRACSGTVYKASYDESARRPGMSNQSANRTETARREILSRTIDANRKDRKDSKDAMIS